MKKILVCGLPGSGKTYFSTKLKEMFGEEAVHYNADDVRKQNNDWDFSPEGRKRQASRMRSSAELANNMGKHAILDFVCPKQEYRDIVSADLIFWVKRTPVRDFPDTTAMFEPLNASLENLTIIDDNTDVDALINQIHLELKTLDFDYNKPTALMIGRYQPFHDGHKALFIEALKKHGQVCIAIRDMPSSASNPFSVTKVVDNIHAALVEYRGKYVVEVLPNIVDVVYGRDVGWTVSKIDLPDHIESISATKVREQLRKEGKL